MLILEYSATEGFEQDLRSKLGRGWWIIGYSTWRRGVFKDKFYVCAEEWIVESLTGNVPDFEGRLQVYF